MNWQGLLNWSIQTQGEHKANTSLKPLSAEEKAWLEEAVAEYNLDIVKEMKASIQNLREATAKARSPELEEEMLVEFDMVVDWIQGHDGSLLFWQLGGLQTIFRIIFDSTFSSKIQNAACLVASESLRNEIRVQLQCLEYAPFDIVHLILGATDDKNRLALFNVISALVKGVCLALKRVFVDIEGIEFCLELYRSSTLPGLKRKIFALFEDLLLYDSSIGGPEDIIMTEQDKNILKGKASKHLSLADKTRDSGAQQSAELTEEVRDNKRYTNVGKRKLFEGDFLSLFLAEVADEQHYFETYDSQERARFLQTAKVVYLYGLVHKKQPKVDPKSLRQAVASLASRIEGLPEDEKSIEQPEVAAFLQLLS